MRLSEEEALRPGVGRSGTSRDGFEKVLPSPKSRQSGVQWTLMGCRIDPITRKTKEIECNFIKNKKAVTMAPIIESRLADVENPEAETDCAPAFGKIFRNIPELLKILSITVRTSRTLSLVRAPTMLTVQIRQSKEIPD